MALSDKNAPAQLMHAGVSADAVGPGAASAATNVPDPDSDAREAVEEMLKETGGDRAKIEGPPSGLTLPSQKDDLQTDKPAGKDGAAPVRDKGGKFVAGDDAAAAADGKPATPATPAVPAAGADADLDLNLTAEDLAEIEKNPLAKKAYKVMVRGLNKKMMEIADRRKGMEADLDVIDRVKKSPTAGLQALAAVLGIPITIGQSADATTAAATAAQLPADPLAAVQAKLEQVLTPDGAKALMPILVELIQGVTGKDLAPIRQDLAAGRQATVMTQIDRALLAYGSSVKDRGDEWTEEIQAGMTELIGKIRPGQGITLDDYLDVLYDRVNGQKVRTQSRQRTLERLRAAAGATEPIHAARPDATRTRDRQITADMGDEEATDLAVAQTLEEMGLRG